MSGLFDDPTPPRRGGATTAPQPQRSRALLATAAVLIVGFFILSAFTGIWTDKLWFGSLGYSEVFGKLIWTRVLLFAVFGGFMALVVGVNLFLAFRLAGATPGRQQPTVA